MNKVILMGRLTRDPEVRYLTGDKPMAVARYTLAVDRRTKEGSADFIQCKAFDKKAEFAEKYLSKGIKIVVAGRIQTGSYVNRDGVTVNTFEVVVDECEFAESRKADRNGALQGGSMQEAAGTAGGFINIPDGIDDELPFN